MPNEPNHGPVCVGLDNGCPDCTRLQDEAFGAAQQQPEPTLLDFDSPIATGHPTTSHGGSVLHALTADRVLDAIDSVLDGAGETLSEACRAAVGRRVRSLFSRAAGGS